MSNRLSTTDISERIGLTLTVDFIVKTLGVAHREQEKRARFWYEEDYLAICDALALYIHDRAKAPLNSAAALKPIADAVAPTPAAAPAVDTPPWEDEDMSILG